MSDRARDTAKLFTVEGLADGELFPGTGDLNSAVSAEFVSRPHLLLGGSEPEKSRERARTAALGKPNFDFSGTIRDVNCVICTGITPSMSPLGAEGPDR